MTPYQRALLMVAPKAIDAISNVFQKTPQRKVSDDTLKLRNKTKQIAKEGLYGQGVKNEIFTDAKQVAQEGDMKIRSQAIKQGIENSGIQAEQLVKKDAQTTLQLARLAKEIHQANEQSKIDALRSTAELSEGINDTRYQNALAKFQRGRDVFGGFADALSTGTEGYLEGVRLKGIRDAIEKIDPDDDSLALEVLRGLYK